MRICLRYAENYEDAANNLHDGFIKIFTKMESYNASGDIVGWMKRIIINTNIDYTRSRKKNQNIPLENVPDIEEEKQEENFIIDEKDLLSLIKKLPEKQALVFNLFVIDDYSHDKIAELMEMTVGASKWHLFCARKTLKEIVSALIKDHEQDN